MNTISDLRKKFERRKGEIDSLTKTIRSNKLKIKELKNKQGTLEKALIVAQEVSHITHRHLNDSLSNLVTLSMESVLDEPYEFCVDFVTRRNQIEVDLFLKRNEKLYSPLKCGGGVRDVVSLGLRFSTYVLQSKPRTRPIIIMDEPNTSLKGSEMPEKGAAIIKTIADKLGLQIIIVSHNSELIDSADTIIEVTQKNRISKAVKKEN